MDEYVRLFAVHPDYIGTFERLVFTEKRGALVTLRDQIQAILDDDVPEDRPGLIGYDKFWDTVKSNQVLRADPNIGPVLKVSEVLTETVNGQFISKAPDTEQYYLDLKKDVDYDAQIEKRCKWTLNSSPCPRTRYTWGSPA